MIKWHVITMYMIIIIIIMGRMGICFTSVATSWWGEACCLLLCFPKVIWQITTAQKSCFFSFLFTAKHCFHIIMSWQRGHVEWPSGYCLFFIMALSPKMTNVEMERLRIVCIHLTFAFPRPYPDLMLVISVAAYILASKLLMSLGCQQSQDWLQNNTSSTEIFFAKQKRNGGI